MEASEILRTRRDWSPEARLFLASTRAGSLLQLAKMQPEAGLLEEAERALKVAWAAKSGDEAFRVMWRTLDRFAGRDRDGRIEP